MTYESTNTQIAESHYAVLFEALPRNMALIKNAAPIYTSLPPMPAYLKATGYSNKMIDQGYIWAKSETRKGARFKTLLPIN